jgi:hypothetical protein
MSVLPQGRADADVAKMGRSLMHADAPATVRQRGRYRQSAEACSSYFGVFASTRAAHLFSRSALHYPPILPSRPRLQASSELSNTKAKFL